MFEHFAPYVFADFVPFLILLAVVAAVVIVGCAGAARADRVAAEERADEVAKRKAAALNTDAARRNRAAFDAMGLSATR